MSVPRDSISVKRTTFYIATGESASGDVSHFIHPHHLFVCLTPTSLAPTHLHLLSVSPPHQWHPPICICLFVSPPHHGTHPYASLCLCSVIGRLRPARKATKPYINTQTTIPITYIHTDIGRLRPARKATNPYRNTQTHIPTYTQTLFSVLYSDIIYSGPRNNTSKLVPALQNLAALQLP